MLTYFFALLNNRFLIKELQNNWYYITNLDKENLVLISIHYKKKSNTLNQLDLFLKGDQLDPVGYETN